MISVYCIGLGRQFTTHLLPVLEDFIYQDDVVINGICDKNPERLSSFGSSKSSLFGDNNIFKVEDSALLIEHALTMEKPKEKKLAIVSTFPSTHFQIALDFLNAGFNVYVDKPLATSYTDAKELVDIAENRGLLLVVGCQRRYEGVYAKILSLVEQIGAVQRISCHAHGNFEKPDVKSEEANVLNGTGYHLLDTIAWLINTLFPQATIIHCGSLTLPWSTNPVSISCFDSLFLVKVGNRDVPVYVSSSMLSPWYTVDEAFVIQGELGEIQLIRRQVPRTQKPGTLELVLNTESKEEVQREIFDTQNMHVNRGDPLREMINCILNNNQVHRSNGQLGLETVKLIDTIITSDVTIEQEIFGGFA